MNFENFWSLSLEIFNFKYLWFSFSGVALGTLVGVLPGLGPLAAISILLPMVIDLKDPIAAIILLSGIYYGAQYGGSTTAILLKLPGEVSSLVSMNDGYALSQQGRGSAALSIAAISSFIAGTIATILILILAIPLSTLAFAFGPTEYAALLLLGLIASISIGTDSFTKGLTMLLIGALFGLIGYDVNSSATRFTFGIDEIYDGISFGIVAMGMFGLTEVAWLLLTQNKQESTDILYSNHNHNLYPTKEEFKQSIPAALRGTGVGSLFGLLPGIGVAVSSMFGYTLEKKISKHPEKFGKGAFEGLASAEAANNATAQTGFIPMLSLGLPTTSVMALMIAALIASGVQPGPGMIEQHSNLFWVLIASMWLGNLFLLVLNLPLVGLWIKILHIPRKILVLLITLACIYGAYSINNSWTDVFLLIPFLFLGLTFKFLEFDITPLAMGFVISPMLEEYLRRALLISQGNWLVFLQSPLSLIFIILAVSAILFKFLFRISALKD